MNLSSVNALQGVSLYRTSCLFAFSILLLVSSTGCSKPTSVTVTQSQDNVIQKDWPSLSETYAKVFTIGAAVNRDQVTERDNQSSVLVKRHFNSITAENDLKWGNIHPVEGQFDFTGADAFVQYGVDNNLQVIGHVLVWHEQTPDWLFVDDMGDTVSREVLIERMRTHINAVAGRYQGKIAGWDVVNEALNEDGSFRQSKWFEILGPDFIEYAFKFAAEAAPNAQLYYNDYNLFKFDKMSGALGIVHQLRSKGIRIDGIGAQAHYGLETPVDELRVSIFRAVQSNIEIMITELDITVLKFPTPDKMGADVSLNIQYSEEFNPFANGISDEAQAQLAQSYTSLFELFWEYRSHISRVTMWGVSDNDSWRNSWPIQGRTDYPLLFDREYQPKPFFDDLIAIPKNAPDSNVNN